MIPGAAAATAESAWNDITSDVNEHVRRFGMTPRQRELNLYYSYYRAQQYGTRKFAWDGSEHLDPLDTEAVASRGFVPPGFYNAGAEVPLKFRRPVAPHHLTRIVVHRRTGLLFSERRHPTVRVMGDPITQDYLDAIIEESRMWSVFANVRNLGGAMGSVAVGFQFVEGKPVLEVFDPRWATPTFDPKNRRRLLSLEILYQQPASESYLTQRAQAAHARIGEEYEDVLYWHRRVITQDRDIIFKPIPVDEDGHIPREAEDERVHNFGFCPVVWIQNSHVQDSMDGDPDCIAIYDTSEQIDALTAQAILGTLANADPTVVIASDASLGEIRKGSDNAIKLKKGDQAQYMELNGAGATACMEIASKLEERALQVAEVVLEHPESTVQTATEIERRYDSMTSGADQLREQYGQYGVKPLCEMMLKAARAAQQPRLEVVGEMPQVVMPQIVLPPRYEEANGVMTEVPRKLGPGTVLKLVWPPYFLPSQQDALTATQAASAAVQAGFLDMESAAMFAAPQFGVEDVPAMLKKAQAEKAQAQAEAEAQAASMMGEGW